MWGVQTFEHAISDGEGGVDAGYLALFWTMLVTVAMVPLVILTGMGMAFAFKEKASEILMGTAAIVGALGAQCAAVVGAVGMFRMGDKPRAVVPVVAPSMVSMPNAEVTVQAQPAEAPAASNKG